MYELYSIKSGYSVMREISGKRAALSALKALVDKGEYEQGNRWVFETDEIVKLVAINGQVLQRISIRETT